MFSISLRLLFVEVWKFKFVSSIEQLELHLYKHRPELSPSFIMTRYCPECGYPYNPSIDSSCSNCYYRLATATSLTATLSAESFTNSFSQSQAQHVGHHLTFVQLNDGYAKSAINGIISKPAEEPGDGKRRKYWNCCECGDGPHGQGTILACPSCDHVQCSDCVVVKLKRS
jgi:hypothetical protein